MSWVWRTWRAGASCVPTDDGSALRSKNMENVVHHNAGIHCV